ncbi:hypothetical protein WA026_003635 [Henosepilachna vigintioctopunctata]|uniref:Cytochrome b-c1 complex subunit 7 n=1 Tax=Henosepilachna vigintioctopunctata TaxID=420089 RepID=A0AAW1UDR2_9CUCU
MNLNLIQRRFMSSGLQNICYKLSGFNKYGLWRDDLLDEDITEVKEALKRLDPKIRNERNFRILRAIQLSIQKEYLPRNEWTKLENDILYLQPIIKQVKEEQEEINEWNKLY